MFGLESNLGAIGVLDEGKGGNGEVGRVPGND